jgi:hypothetical protein
VSERKEKEKKKRMSGSDMEVEGTKDLRAMVKHMDERLAEMEEKQKKKVEEEKKKKEELIEQLGQLRREVEKAKKAAKKEDEDEGEDEGEDEDEAGWVCVRVKALFETKEGNVKHFLVPLPWVGDLVEKGKLSLVTCWVHRMKLPLQSEEEKELLELLQTAPKSVSGLLVDPQAALKAVTGKLSEIAEPFNNARAVLNEELKADLRKLEEETKAAAKKEVDDLASNDVEAFWAACEKARTVATTKGCVRDLDMSKEWLARERLRTAKSSEEFETKQHALYELSEKKRGDLCERENAARMHEAERLMKEEEPKFMELLKGARYGPPCFIMVPHGAKEAKDGEKPVVFEVNYL